MAHLALGTLLSAIGENSYLFALAVLHDLCRNGSPVNGRSSDDNTVLFADGNDLVKGDVTSLSDH